MHVAATADIHGHLPEVPECDLLILAGDLCPDFLPGHGGYDPKNGALQQADWLRDEFCQWLWDAPAETIVGVAGNHDFVFEFTRLRRSARLPWTYLQDNGTEVGGLKIHGLPWVPNLPFWAFYGGERLLQLAYENVPDDTDIVISHGPPKGILDVAPGARNVGAPQANEMIERVRPKFYVCGHIHDSAGAHIQMWAEGGQTVVANVAHVNESYEPTNPVAEFDV